MIHLCRKFMVKVSNFLLMIQCHQALSAHHNEPLRFVASKQQVWSTCQHSQVGYSSTMQYTGVSCSQHNGKHVSIGPASACHISDVMSTKLFYKKSYCVITSHSVLPDMPLTEQSSVHILSPDGPQLSYTLFRDMNCLL